MACRRARAFLLRLLAGLGRSSFAQDLKQRVAEIPIDPQKAALQVLWAVPRGAVNALRTTAASVSARRLNAAVSTCRRFRQFVAVDEDSSVDVMAVSGSSNPACAISALASARLIVRMA